MMKKANQKMQVEVVADHEEASEESELTTFETMQELYQGLLKSRRDPEFGPIDYICEILRRLQNLPGN